MDISNKISLLDDEFSKLMETGCEDSFNKNVSTILRAFGNGKHFTVNIIDTIHKNKEPFFGMRVFPDITLMKHLVEKMVNSNNLSLSEMCARWKNISKWNIEIDARVFDRDTINFNPQELTAMLLHEIGHTAYSDKKIEMFYRVYTECKIKMSMVDKATAKILFRLYMIPLALTCGIRDWKITNMDLKEEIFADQSVTKLGYGEHLISAYRKIIKSYGSGGYYDDSLMEKEIERSIDWCNLNINDMVRRKNKIINELYRTATTTASEYLRNLITSIMDHLNIKKFDRYTSDIVTESCSTIDFDDSDFLSHTKLIYAPEAWSKFESNYLSMKNEANRKGMQIAQELFSRRKKDEHIPNQLDVDTIFVEVDRISNHADRRYVLDLIYHQEDRINSFLETCEYNDDLKKKYYNKMMSMLSELESMRKQVLAKRNFDKDYKVFVKYPAGYEG